MAKKTRKNRVRHQTHTQNTVKRTSSIATRRWQFPVFTPKIVLASPPTSGSVSQTPLNRPVKPVHAPSRPKTYQPTTPCAKRAQRRSILFSTNRAGKNGQKTRKLTPQSNISC